MAKLSARGRDEVFRLKKSWADREDDTKDSITWLSFRNDGVALKKITWRSWDSFAEKWVSRATGWKVWRKCGHKWAEQFPAMKTNLLENGWEEA